VNGLIDNLRTLSRGRLIALAATGAGVVLAVAAMAMFLSRPQMTAVYTGLDPAEAGRVLKEVEAMGVPAAASFDGTAIEVPAADVSRVRMGLAEKGLPSRGGVGYELFDTDKPLGVTSFMQRMNRLRALEGELGRTIETLSGVETARVHIVLPDREEFSRTAPTPSASVVVRMRGGDTLEKKRAIAVRRLISAAVPNLKSADVTVLDGSGELVLADEDGGAGVSERADGRRVGEETRIARAVEQMLAARLGRGNARVQVSVDVENKREVVRSQTFDPESQVVRSTQTSNERERNQDQNGQPPVTVEQNLPQREVRAANTDGRTSSDSNRREETINYEISNVSRETVIEPGDIRRVNIAVLVNGSFDTTADGVKTYRPRTEDELRRITELVRTAVGYQEARGDRVTVENLEFVDVEPKLEPVSVGEEVAAALGRNVMTLIQWVILAALCGLLILVGLRPMIRRVFPAPEPVREGAAATGEAGGTVSALASPDPVLRLPAPEGEATGTDIASVGAAETQLPGIDQTVDQMIELRTVEGRVRASSIRRLGDIVDRYPDEAIDILRSWLYEEAA